MINEFINRIIVDPMLPRYEMVRCTWKERLFTCPWEPWRGYKKVPIDMVYVVNNMVICRPDQAQMLKKEIQNEKNNYFM